MSKELKIKGALSKDYQQLYVDDIPIGVEINNEGKVRIKNLVIVKDSLLANETLKINKDEPVSLYGVSGTLSADNQIHSTGGLAIRSSENTLIITDGGNVNILDESAFGGVKFQFACSINQFKMSDDTTGDTFQITMSGDGVTEIATSDLIGDVAHMTIKPNGDLILDPYSQNTIINATDKLNFDGASGTGTYIYESSDDILNFFVGGFRRIELDEGNDINTLLGETRLLDKDATTYSSADGRAVQTKAQIDAAIAVKVARVGVSEAEMNALHTTEKVIVAAQGANQVIVPTSGMLFIDRDGSTPQVEGGANFHMSWDGGKGYATTAIYYIRRFMYNEAGDRIFNLQHYTGECGQSLTAGDNKPLTVVLDGAITSGSIDSMKVVVSYYVYDNS